MDSIKSIGIEVEKPLVEWNRAIWISFGCQFVDRR